MADNNSVVKMCYYGNTDFSRIRENSSWLFDKIIGDPQPTEVYNVEELKKTGSVGVYSEYRQDYEKLYPEYIVDLQTCGQLRSVREIFVGPFSKESSKYF